jgi:ribosomal subunit interface protein
MDIRISGRSVEIGQALRSRAEQRLDEIADKYFARALSAAVTVGREAHGHGFHVDCSMHVQQGVMLKAEASAAEANAAFDAAAERIEKQLRRYKRRLKNHQTGANGKDFAVEPASAYVVEQVDHEAEVPEGDNPVIIAETAATIPTVSVSDAVMLMDLAHAPALMFRNAGRGTLSLVYRRPDGHIGWVDSGANA